MSGKIHTTALFLLLATLAALPRLWHLGQAPLWGDEVLSATAQYQPLAVLVAEQAKTHTLLGPVEPPGYHLLNKWVTLFQPDPATAMFTAKGRFLLRLLSAICGVLLVFFIYRLAGRLLEPGAAWLPTVMISGSFYAIYYSRENRPFALISLVATAATWLFVEVFFRRRRLLAPFYALAMGTIGYLAYPAVLLGLVHGAAFLVIVLARLPFDRDDPSTRLGYGDGLLFILCGMGALLLLSPWLPYTWHMATDPGAFNPVDPAAGGFSFPWRLVLSMLAHWGCGGYPGLVTYGLAALIGLGYLLRRHPAAGALAVAFYLLPFAYLSLSPYGIHFHPRYLIFIFPIHQLLAGIGVVKASEKLPHRFTPAAASRAAPQSLFAGLLLAVFLAQNALALAPYYLFDIKCSADNCPHEKYCRAVIEPMWNSDGLHYLSLPENAAGSDDTATRTAALASLAVGQEAYTRGEYRQATVQFLAASLALPENVDALLGLAQALTAAGSGTAAIPYWNRLLDGPATFGHKLEAVNALLDAELAGQLSPGAFGQAWETLFAAYRTAPAAAASLWQAKQRFKQAQGDWAAALAAVREQRLIAQPEQLAGLNISEAAVLRRLDRPDQAQVLLSANVDTLLPTDPLYAESALMMAALLAAQGETDRAAGLTERAAAATAEPAALATTVLAVAAAYRSAEQSPKALAWLSKMQEHLRGEQRALVLIEAGKIHLDAGRSAEADTLFAEALALTADPAARDWLTETVEAISRGETGAPAPTAQ